MLGVLSDDQLCEAGVPADAPSARLQVVIAGGAPCEFRTLPGDSTRLAYWLGGTPAEKPDVYRDASPANYVTPDDPPMFFFHGDADRLVPPRSARRMVGQLIAARVAAVFYRVPKAGHIAALFDREALRRSRAFADHYLKADPESGAVQPSPGDRVDAAAPVAPDREPAHAE